MLGAAAVSIIVGCIKDGFPDGLIDGFSILFALTIISVVNSSNNYISERKLRDLISLTEKQEVAVFRGSSSPVTIDSTELVVGDVYLLDQGMRIPADSVVL